MNKSFRKENLKNFIEYEWNKLENSEIAYASRDKEISLTDVPTLIIGIGGTGVEAARTVKKKVEQQYHSNAASKIEYLFIDTDGASVSDINGADKLVIQSADTAILLGEYQKQKAKNLNVNPSLPPEITEWLDPNLSPFRVMNGAAGIRQAGRLILFLNINRVYRLLKQKMNKVSIGYDLQKHRVKVHIFTGIGGGTGSGIFADISYLIRTINPYAQLQGFVFMPDVSCMKKGLHEIHRRNIKRNAYAALLELEQLMTLEQYGEKFEQKYPGNVPKVDTSFPIFDFCVIIGSQQNGRKALESEKEVLDCVAEYLLLELTQNVAGAHGIESHKSNLENQSNNQKLPYCTKYLSVGARVWRLSMDEYFGMWLKDVCQKILDGLSDSSYEDYLKNEILHDCRENWKEESDGVPLSPFAQKKRKEKIDSICIKMNKNVGNIPMSYQAKLYLLGDCSSGFEEKITKYSAEYKLPKSKNRKSLYIRKHVFPDCYNQALNSKHGHSTTFRQIQSKADEFKIIIELILDKCAKNKAYDSELIMNLERINDTEEYKTSLEDGVSVIVNDYLKNTEIWLGEKPFTNVTCLPEYIADLVKDAFNKSGYTTIAEWISNTCKENVNKEEEYFRSKVSSLSVEPLWPIAAGRIAETLSQYTDYKVVAHPYNQAITRWAEKWCADNSDQIQILPNRLNTSVVMGVHASGYYLQCYHGLDEFKYEYDNATNRSGIHLYAGDREDWNRPFTLYYGGGSDSEEKEIQMIRAIFDDAIENEIIVYSKSARKYIRKKDGTPIGHITVDDSQGGKNITFEFFIRMQELRKAIDDEVNEVKNCGQP